MRERSAASEHTALKLLYGLNDRPPAWAMGLYSLQWLVLSLPFVVLVGSVASGQHLSAPELRVIYLQKTAFITGLMMLGQALLGHRLTLVAGPATALLLGVTGSHASPAAIYTAIAVCGALLAILSATGLLNGIRGLFSPRVIATVVLLIGFTMTPTVIRLLTASHGITTTASLTFSACYVFVLLLAHRFLPASTRSILIVAGMIGGTAAFSGLFGVRRALGDLPAIATFSQQLTAPVFDLGAILSFLLCFLALSINEAGSMHSVEPLLAPDGLDSRFRRGMTVTGVVNLLAGLLGVVGPVDYSLSPGVISASGCGSRFPLIPTSLAIVLLSFSPLALGAAGSVPDVVVGGTLVYALAGQIAAGMSTALARGTFAFEDGLVIGVPLVVGTVVANLPVSALAAMPPAIIPVAGNGFVVGVGAVLILDQLFQD